MTGWPTSALAWLKHSFLFHFFFLFLLPLKLVFFPLYKLFNYVTVTYFQTRETTPCNPTSISAFLASFLITVSVRLIVCHISVPSVAIMTLSTFYASLTWFLFLLFHRFPVFIFTCIIYAFIIIFIPHSLINIICLVVLRPFWCSIIHKINPLT